MGSKSISVDIMRNGEVIYTSKSIVDASIYANMSTTSIKHMLDNGMQIQGFTARHHQEGIILPLKVKEAIRETIKQLEREYKVAEDTLKMATANRNRIKRVLEEYIAKYGKGE